MRERWRLSALEHFVPNGQTDGQTDGQSDSLSSLTEPKMPNTIQCCIWECTFPWRGKWNKEFHVSRNCLCFINYPADSHSNYPPLSFFSSSPSRWITGVIRMNVCPALNEIVISVVVISVGDMNHCPSVLTSSHPAPGYRQPSHANSLAHRVQFSPSNKAPG